MAILNEDVRSKVQEEFEGLSGKVKLVVFTQEFECAHCRENTSLAQEVAALSDQLDIEVYNFALDNEMVERYEVDKIPAIAVEGEKDYGVRFYGVPAGYEFTNLIEHFSRDARCPNNCGKALGSGQLDILKRGLRGRKINHHVSLAHYVLEGFGNLYSQLAQPDDLAHILTNALVIWVFKGPG